MNIFGPITGGCDGTRESPCYLDVRTPPLTIDPSQLADGAGALSYTATNIVGTTGSLTALNLDRVAPNADIGGSLWGADGASIDGSSYSLTVDADDTDQDGVATSGVKSITVKVDGTVKDTQQVAGCTSTGCPQTTPSTYTWTFNSAAYGNGIHVIEVDTADAAGNVDAETAQVTVEHQPGGTARVVPIDSSTGLTITGASSGDRAGWSVANTGDVNNDGHDDYLVGAPGVSYQGRLKAGAAYLVLGSSTPGGSVTLSTSDPRVLQFGGAVALDHAGYAVAPGGDVNGDGYPDLLIGAPGAAVDLPFPGVIQTQGNAYVIFGGPTIASLDLGTLAGSGKGFAIKGPALSLSLGGLLGPEPVLFGSAFASRRVGGYGTPGDVNRDGLDDVVIPASGMTAPTGQNDAGAVYVLFGKANSNTIDLGASSGDPGSAGYRIVGHDPFAQAGQGVALPGDVNDDGRADLLITAPGENAGARTNAGTAYVIYGKTDTATQDLGALGSGGYPIYGATGDRLITAAAVSSDDYGATPNLLIGGNGAYQLYSDPAATSVDLASTYNGYRINPPAARSAQTADVSDAGDADGDGAPDALISYPQTSTTPGGTYVVYSKTDNTPITLDSLPPAQGTQFIGTTGTPARQPAAGIDNADDDESAVITGGPMTNSETGRAKTVRYVEALSPEPTYRGLRG